MHPLETTTGSLLVAVPLFISSWLLGAGRPPASLPDQALWSIVYLGIMGSVVGFTLYFGYICKSCPTTWWSSR